MDGGGQFYLGAFMELTLSLVLFGFVAGLINIWIFQWIIDWLFISRMMDDPVNGKILATILAYTFGSFVYLFGSNLWLGFFFYLPGAFLIGWLEIRKGYKMRAAALEADESTVFE